VVCNQKQTLQDIHSLIELGEQSWSSKMAALRQSGVPLNAYDNVVSRTDASALMPEEVSREVLTHTPDQSAALTLFRHVTMGRKQQRLPILAALPVAYFVNGDTGLKQTTELAWANKYLEAEEIACIVPIPEAVLDDSGFPIWDEARPLIVEAVGRTIDAAIFFGVNKPSTWPASIVSIATGAGNTVTRGTNAAAAGGIAGDISDLFGTVEADGFDVNSIVAVRTIRGRLRQARTTQGSELSEVSQTSAYGENITFPMRGLWPTGTGAAEMVAGDFSQGFMGIRQDITWKMLSEAVIQDNTGAIVFNLAQQDMVALRVVIRVAFQVSNVVNYDQPTEASRSPWGVLLAP